MKHIYVFTIMNISIAKVAHVLGLTSNMEVIDIKQNYYKASSIRTLFVLFNFGDSLSATNFVHAALYDVVLTSLLQQLYRIKHPAMSVRPQCR